MLDTATEKNLKKMVKPLLDNAKPPIKDMAP